jgi:hypothetical protein
MTDNKNIKDTLLSLSNEEYYLISYTYNLPPHLPKNKFQVLHRTTLQGDSLFAMGLTEVSDDGLVTKLNIYEVTEINHQVLMTFPIIEGVSINFDTVTPAELKDKILPIVEDGGFNFIIKHSDPVIFNGQARLV